MANLLGWLGKEVAAPIRRDVFNPIGHLVSQGENTVAAAGAGVGGLARATAGAVTHNPVAEQNALNQTNQAINNRLALNHAFLTAQQAHQGGTALIKPTLSAAGQIAPFALGPELKGATALGSILRPAAAFGGLGAATTAVQGGNRNQIIKSGLTNAAAGGIGGGIGVGVRGAPAVARAVNDIPKNEVGAVGKNVKLTPNDIKSLQKQGFDQNTINKMAGPQGEKVAAPTIPKPTQNYGNIIPQTYKQGKLRGLTSVQNMLSKNGETGPKALQAFRNTQVSERMNLQQFRNATKPFNDLTPAEQEVARQVHQGTGTSTNPAINAGAESLTSFYGSILPNAKTIDPNWKIGNLGKNYFPEMAPKDWLKNKDNFNKVTQDMVNSGKASNLQDAASKINKITIQDSTKPTEFGNFKPREKNIESPIPAGEAHNAYMKGVAKRFAQVQNLGLKNQVLDKLKAEAVTKGEDAGALSKAMSAFTNPETAKPGAVTTGLNAYQKGLRVVQLPRAAVSHGPQGLANTASDVGYKNYFHGLANKVFKDPEMANLEAKSGINSESFGKSSNISDKATAPGLGHLIDFHRRVAFRAGAYFAKDAAKKGDTTALGKMGVDGTFAKNADGSIKLTDTQLIKAGHFEADKSIGSHSALESPAWIGSNKGKFLGMYRKMYVFKQAERIAGLFSEAKKGNVVPLARYLAIGVPLSGVAIAAAKNEIKNPGSNPVGSPKTFAGQALYNSGALALGYGAADSAFNAATHNYGNNSRWSNAGAAVSPALGFGIQTGQNVDKAARGNPTSLKREGFGFLPAGGTALANKFAPNKPFLAPDTTGKAPDTPQQRNVNAKAELQKLKNDPNVGNGYNLSPLADGKWAYSLDGESDVHTAADKKTAAKAIAADSFDKSGASSKILGQTYYYRDQNDKATSMPLYQHQFNVADSKNQLDLYEAKDAGDYTAWSAAANKQLATLEDLKNHYNQDSQGDKVDDTQKKIDTLKHDMAKYASYGGDFTKPKKAKKPSSAIASFKTAGSNKIAKPKGVSVKKLAAPSFKAPKTNKLAVSKIPVVTNRRKA